MRLGSIGVRGGLALGVVVLAVACDQSPTAPSTPTGVSTPGRAIRSIEVVGPTVVSTGETARYTAFAQYSDGARDEVTGAVQWAPGTPPGGSPQTCLHSLCFTGPPGVAWGVRPGETRVFAAYQGTMSEVPVGVVDPGTFEITGVVTEPGGGPLLGALVELTAGTGQGLQARTDTNGRYGIYGVAGPVQVRVSAEGFAPKVLNLVVAARGAMHAIELTPLEQAADVTGTWTMTLAPSPACRDGLPGIARGRAYQVEFIQRGTRLQWSISGPTLTVHPYPPGQTGTVLGSRVRLQFIGDSDNGGWTWPDIFDRLSSTEQFGFVGTVDGVVSNSAVRGTLDGDLLYFDSETDRNEPTWFCRAKDHAVTLQR